MTDIYGLPRIDITVTGTITRETKLTGTISLTNAGESRYPETQLYTGPMEINIAGNSTSAPPKKPYNITLLTSTGSKVDAPLLGMPPGRDWRLLAEAFDLSGLRNHSAYTLANMMGLPWAPKTRLAEVWINGAFIGLYTLAERVKRHVNRINLNGTGSFLVERIANYEAGAGDVLFNSPVAADLTGSGWASPTSWVQDWPDALLPADVVGVTAFLINADNALTEVINDEDPSAWQPVIWQTFDFQAAVDYYVWSEMCDSAELHVKGYRLCRDASGVVLGGRLFFAGWDFDLSQRAGNTLRMATNAYFSRFLLDPAFVAAVASRIRQTLPLFHQAVDILRSNALRLSLSGAYARNFALWGTLDNPHLVPLSPSAEADAAQLIAWRTARISWLAGQYGVAPEVPAGTGATGRAVLAAATPAAARLAIRADGFRRNVTCPAAASGGLLTTNSDFLPSQLQWPYPGDVAGLVEILVVGHNPQVHLHRYIVRLIKVGFGEFDNFISDSFAAPEVTTLQSIESADFWDVAVTVPGPPGNPLGVLRVGIINKVGDGNPGWNLTVFIKVI